MSGPDLAFHKDAFSIVGRALEKNMHIDRIARIAHEANRAYCLSINDPSQVAWDDAPSWQQASARHGVEFHLAALAKGETPSPAASHAAWWAEKAAAGWISGPVKNESLRQHPCCVPYDQLPHAQRLKDTLFAAIVMALVAADDPKAALPRYECHKIVRAAKITLIFSASSDPEPSGWQDRRLALDGCGDIDVTGKWMGRHQPHVGGYYVLYDDGYASFSPAAAFEAGYTRIDG